MLPAGLGSPLWAPPELYLVCDNDPIEPALSVNPPGARVLSGPDRFLGVGWGMGACESGPDCLVMPFF